MARYYHCPKCSHRGTTDHHAARWLSLHMVNFHDGRCLFCGFNAWVHGAAKGPDVVGDMEKHLAECVEFKRYQVKKAMEKLG